MDSALKYYEYAKDSFHDFGNMKAEGIALLRLSRLYQDLLEMPKAISSAKRAKQLLIQAGDAALENNANARVQQLNA